LSKKDKVITLRMREDSFDIIRDFAESQGLSVNAYLNSIIETYVEWLIPTDSYVHLMVPRKMMIDLFNSLTEKDIQRLSDEWGREAKNATIMMGKEFTLENAIEFLKKVSKYFTNSNIRVITNKQQIIPSDNYDIENYCNSDILLIIRHELGQNFSKFYSGSTEKLLNMLENVKTSTEYDNSTIFIKIKKLEW
jgi:chromosomal replication initiation ATPase DnaA